jgi:hypothetical protein
MVGLCRKWLGSVLGKGLLSLHEDRVGPLLPHTCSVTGGGPEEAPGCVGNFYLHSEPDSVFPVSARGRCRVSGPKGTAPVDRHRADGRGACHPRLGSPVPSTELVLSGAWRKTPTPRPILHFARGLASRNALWIRVATVSAVCPLSALMPPGPKTCISSGKATTKPDR